MALRGAFLVLRGAIKLYKRSDYTGARMQAGEYRKALAEFGLTAASAGRVGFLGGAGKPEGEDDPTAEFFGPRLAK